MSSGYFSMFDMAIAGIPALVFAVWQLVSINREIARDKRKAAARRDSAAGSGASPESAGHPVREHRLDDR